MQAEPTSALGNARRALLDARVSAGHWRGELSSSALSTATAALALAHGGGPGRESRDALAVRGRAWLAAHANADGGYGDTVDSPSNLATTALVWSALVQGARAVSPSGAERVARRGAERWLETRLASPSNPSNGSEALSAARLAAALEEVYGEDRTFAVPILVACALGGAFEGDASAWRSIRRLPFELAALPQGLFRFLGLPVVSYALPALIAIGQVIEARRPSGNPLARLTRRAARRRTLATLARIQPAGGGFLEATPLTSFVILSLLGAGAEADAHGARVIERGVQFLERSVRSDGSWPIDTDLATWVTTLAIGALDGEVAGVAAHLDDAARRELRAWLLAQQGRARHVYTGAAPGGWAWTDLSGGVPDADDTPGALLALRALSEGAPREASDVDAAARGLRWLVDLQNRDGGFPTFCRGYGALPFDQSSCDLTAHALRAFAAWEAEVAPALARRIARAARRGRAYLARAQRPDGSWVPLWFGSQAHESRENPVYGTSRVLRTAALGAEGDDAWHRALQRGVGYLLAAQAPDGGFGGARGLAASIEETGLALEALAEVQAALHAGRFPAGFAAQADVRGALQRGVAWLCAATRAGTHFPTRPIGLYFAQLWYHERLYPVIFCASALARAERALSNELSNP